LVAKDMHLQLSGVARWCFQSPTENCAGVGHAWDQPGLVLGTQLKKAGAAHFPGRVAVLSSTSQRYAPPSFSGTGSLRK